MRISAATIICLSVMLTGCAFQHKDEEEHTSTSEYTDIETEEIPGVGYYLAEEPETV